MLTFLAKRILQLIPTLFFVSVLIFSLQQLLPGDPAMIMAGEDRDPAVIEQIRKQYRLDQPIPVQYVYWVKGVLSGDLGESMRIKQKVLDLVLQKLPVTMQLASMAIVIALLIGITAGVISAVKKDTVWDYAANVFAVGLSTPNFWLGIMLIFLFSVNSAGCRLRLCAADRGLAPEPGDHDHVTFVLGNAIAPMLMRHPQRDAAGLNSDYVRTARAKDCWSVRSSQARDAQRAHPGDHARRARAWHASFGRGADRADLHHSGLR